MSRKRDGLVFVIGMASAGVLGLLPFATGMIDMSATQSPGLLDGLGELALDTSLFWRAPDGASPVAGKAEAVEAGLHHYAEHCLICHGGPGVKRAPFALGMLPRPPRLDAPDEDESPSDGELFQVISEGIRMTGMPAFEATHSETERWEIVALVQALGSLTPEQRAFLSRVRPRRLP